MKCEPGQHDYRPFPRSRDLYCRFCGDEPNRTRAQTPSTRHTEAGRTAPMQQALPFDEDPDANLARQIIEDQRSQRAEARVRAELEAEVRRIVAESGMPADIAEEMVREAMDFGPELDLDKFADLVNAHGGAAAREPDAADMIP